MQQIRRRLPPFSGRRMRISLRCVVAILATITWAQCDAEPVPRWESVEDVDRQAPRRICPIGMADRETCQIMADPIAWALGPILAKYPKVRAAEPPRFALVVDAILAGGQATTRLGYPVAGNDLAKILTATSCDDATKVTVRVKLVDFTSGIRVEIEPPTETQRSMAQVVNCIRAVHVESARPINNAEAIELVRDLLTSHTEALSRTDSDYSDSFLPLRMWGGPSRFPFALVERSGTAKTVYVAPAADLEAAGYAISTFVDRSPAPKRDFAAPVFPPYLSNSISVSTDNWRLFYAVIATPMPGPQNTVSVTSLLAGLK